MVRPVDILFPKAAELKSQHKCPTCSALIDSTKFRDELSLREYGISGMCQKCQDSVFGGAKDA